MELQTDDLRTSKAETAVRAILSIIARHNQYGSLEGRVHYTLVTTAA